MKNLVLSLIITIIAILSPVLRLVKIKQANKLIMDFEYPYTCGTWFNRGKNTCHFIIEKLEQNNFKVLSSIKAYHTGEFPSSFNGAFNVYLEKNSGDKVLIATSDEKSKVFHNGLKYFAYTFFNVNKTTGERDYIDDYPHKNELVDYVLRRVLEELKTLI